MIRQYTDGYRLFPGLNLIIDRPNHFSINILNSTKFQRYITLMASLIRGFNMILDGEVDYLPEQAFLNVGTIEEAVKKGEALLAQAKE